VAFRIGVLALQGDFYEHLVALKKLKVDGVPVRTVSDIEKTSSLIIPGGESTTISKLLITSGLKNWIIKHAKTGYPIYGTCAGCIILASLGLIDISVKRNAYGRQQDSFAELIQSKMFPNLSGVFIRAPIITRIGAGVNVLATHNDMPVLVQQNNILAGTFHPELTDKVDVHRYFVTLSAQSAKRSASLKRVQEVDAPITTTMIL
jgi:5'-phosphate synthase pdxT subunit